MDQLIPAILGAGVGTTIYLVARAVAILRGGTDARQSRLWDNHQVEIQRNEHNAHQWENQARHAWEWIRKLQTEHRYCEVDVPSYAPPTWQSFEDPRERKRGRSSDEPAP